MLSIPVAAIPTRSRATRAAAGCEPSSTGDATMTRRSGITLVEVLVAILITGVGLLSLLVLFPLGALEMAQAVKDDRTGHAKHNAAAFASIDWPNTLIPGQASRLRTDPDVMNAMLAPNATPTTIPYPAGAPLAPYPATALVNYY